MSQAPADSAENQTAVEEANAPASDSIPETNNQPEAGIETVQGGSGEAEASSDIIDRISGVEGVDEYEAAMAELQSNPDAFSDPAQDQQPEVEEQAEAAPPEGEEEEQAEAAPEAEVAEEGEPESEIDEEEPEGEFEKQPQYRFRPEGKVDAEAFRIYKAANRAGAPIQMSDAIALAKSNLGIESPTPNQESVQNTDNEEVEEDLSSDVTLAEAKQEMKDLRKAHIEALRDGDLDEAADIMEKMVETEDLIEVVEEREQKQEASQRQKHDSEFEESANKASSLFPDFGDQKSEFFARCNEIDEALRETGDPRYFDAGKPLMIAQMAAKELNIAPMVKSRVAKKTAAQKAAPEPEKVVTNTPQQVSPSPQPPRTEKPGQLPAASGASRTSGTPTGAAASLAEQVANIDNPDAFEKLALEVHARTR